ncbi:MAG: (d)CMP kinase [Deltaproteobacteria bacterium]|jgi:cytidylate kinase|nr:(d)CMP kinase [Deltaproteobacteria bacterium]
MNLDTIITIDGPSAAGKSTLARELARCLGWSFLDTGAIYRAVAVVAMEKGLMESSPELLGKFVASLDIRVELTADKSRIFLGDRELTSLIRSEEVGKAASQISSYPEVRRALHELQARLGEKGRLVTEGRDQGTAIFPWARLKFFLTATLEERAKRRHRELLEKNPTICYDDILEKMTSRDRADETREATPLRVAPGAIVLNTTELTQDNVLKIMEEKAREIFSDVL